MKKSLILIGLIATVSASHAELYRFTLSPAGSSPGTGLSTSNVVPALDTNYTGSGGDILTGITFDTNTMQLNLAIGYGSALGFTDLTAPASAIDINGPAPVGSNAPALTNLAGLSLPAGDPAKGGIIFGAVTYTAEGASNLFLGLNYITVSTSNKPSGEIRGQLLLLTNTPPTIKCPRPVVREATSTNGARVKLTAKVGDADGDALTVIWSVNGTPVKTNHVSTNAWNEIKDGDDDKDGDNDHEYNRENRYCGDDKSVEVRLESVFPFGTNQVVISVSDGKAPAVTCSTTVVIRDTRPPEIQKITADPNSLWPPNHQMVPVKISVQAKDASPPIKSKIVAVFSNEPDNGLGDGDTAKDWQITGDLSLKLRAERSGKGKGRIYTIAVEVSDSLGNKRTECTKVTVAHSKGKNGK